MASNRPHPHEGRFADNAVKGPDKQMIRTTTQDGTNYHDESHILHSAAQALSGAAISRRHVVFADPVAFRYLEDEPYVSIIEHRGVLRGYESYLVEQWACSRKSPTLIVVTHTGNPKDSIVVGVLALPKDESFWSARLRLYFRVADQYHARPKETELGELMVTNLSSFPSALTVIPIPDGDVRKQRPAFFLNEDLKRLGCSGRSGLTLTEPTEATRAKFHQLYKTSDRIPFAQSVTELVKLCQVALYMFEKLDQEYIDGLLCDITESAISNWWTEVGTEHYNFEPSDGILGPSTVAALLGMFMGARNRLNWFGAPVPKDVFDIEGTKRGISYFQKTQKMEKTRRLDRQTLFRMHNATAKAAAGEGWGVQKAVKSTVTEIGGKRGEIVMDMVSGRDKAGLADIETLDIGRFTKLVYGDIPKWLWHGKPRRTPFDYMDVESESANPSSSRVDVTSQAMRRTLSQPGDEHGNPRKGDEIYTSHLAPGPIPPAAAYGQDFVDKDGSRRTVFRSVAGKMSDAKSGLGRIKDAVGGSRRGHHSRPSWSAREPFYEGAFASSAVPETQQGNGAATGPAALGRAFTWKNKPEEYLESIQRGDNDIFRLPTEEGSESQSGRTSGRRNERLLGPPFARDDKSTGGLGHLEYQYSRTPSASASEADTDHLKPALQSKRGMPAATSKLVVSRRRSCDLTELKPRPIFNERRWARRLSFSDAEEAVLGWNEIADVSDEDLRNNAAQIAVFSRLTGQIENIVYGIEPWVEKKIKTVASLNQRYTKEATELQALFQQLNEACQQVRSNSDGMLEDERTGMTESIKGVEMLVARLDYEIHALEAKVHDVEEGIRNFERQVDEVESRADQLKLQLETESWLHWFVRTLTGIGTGPNITRSA